jgi:NTE family protein
LRKLGLCLSGGGGRGAYQAGAIKAFDEAGMLDQIAAYSGTSIGAANAAVLVSTSAKTLEDVWFTIPERPLQYQKHLLTRIVEDKLNIFERGIYSMDTFSSILMRHIDETNLKKRKVYVTVSDGGDATEGFFSLLKASYDHYLRKDNRVIYVPLDELTGQEALQAVIASCSIPVVFPAVKHQQRKFYDGGVFDNIPIKPLIAAGCHEIIVIQLSRGLFFHPEDFPGITIHQLKHPGKFSDILNFTPGHIQDLFQRGYQDAKEFLATWHSQENE